MFPFGSVLTNIPLILLAAVYLLYMGAAAVSRSKPCDTSEADAGRSGNIILAEDQNIKDDPGIYYYQSFPGSDIDSASGQEEPDYCLYETKYELILPKVQDMLSFFSGTAIFSRPPPRG